MPDNVIGSEDAGSVWRLGTRYFLEGSSNVTEDVHQHSLVQEICGAPSIQPWIMVRSHTVKQLTSAYSKTCL